MQSGGYTPLSAFRKPNTNQNSVLDDKINSKTPIVATTDQEGISGKLSMVAIVCRFNIKALSTGYVTHKQLSAFGHRMQ